MCLSITTAMEGDVNSRKKIRIARSVNRRSGNSDDAIEQTRHFPHRGRLRQENRWRAMQSTY